MIAALGVAALTLVSTRPVSSHNPVTTTVLFNREVAAILNQKCRQCHVADGMAMPLRTYAETRPWAVAIKEEILARRMPPWPAERGYGAFANDNGLTLREQEFLISWIDGGAPEGEGSPPPHQDHSGHWMIGEPDAIHAVTPDPAARPRAGGLVRFTVDPQLRSEALISALDFKPADRRAIRAAFFSVAADGQYLGGWTPWYSSTRLPENAAFRLPPRTAINVDVLYSESPAPAAPARLGLYFAGSAAHRVENVVLEGGAPAGVGRVHVEQALGGATTLLGLRIEMSEGAKSVELKAMRPDGSFESLLWIRDYRQDWQTPFVLRSPVSLPRGAVLSASAYFDPQIRTPRQVRMTFNGYVTSR